MGLEELKLEKIKTKAEKYDKEKLSGVVREAVMEAIEDSTRGSGYEIGKPEFYRTILKIIVGKEELQCMSDVQFGIWKSRINKVIKELKQQEENKTHSEAEEVKKQEPVVTDEERVKMTDGAKELQSDEMKRSGGVDVEDL
ncbi:MAG: hypothetical protein Q8N21_01110 [bacterium]|nr:hypothetical protein [bacterium]